MNIEEKSFAELFEESLSVPEKGTIFKGLVVRIDAEDVFLDFGSKSEGVAPLGEFRNADGELRVNIGDEVLVSLEAWSSRGEPPKLSKRKADLNRESARIRKAYEDGEILTARVVEKVKGGLIANIGEESEVRAFLPGSQVDIRHQADLDSFIGTKLEARIIKLSNEGVVISRRVWLEEQREVHRKETLSTLEEGKTVSGRVVKIIEKGAFVDIGGIEGFLPISEISWGRIKRPNDVISTGEEIEVKILRLEEGDKITLGHKQTKADPWSFAETRYKPNSRVRGKVVSTAEFGVFIELEPGVEGLVHISEITWTKKFRHPKEIIHVGTAAEAIVLEVDTAKRRISLSLRLLEQSPWEIFKEKTPSGTRVQGKVVNVTDKGVFVEVAEGLVGLMRPSDISWMGAANPEEAFKTGDEAEFVVLNVDDRNRRIALGVKQLQDDPWKEAQRRYKPGESVVTGKVSVIKDRGVIVELADGLEGYMRASDFINRDDNNRDLSKILKVGDEITAQVTGFESKNRQLNLSKKRHEDRVEKEKVSNFMSSQGGDGSMTLGDLLGDKLKSLVKN
ncbi:MAG: 30S ribosomal protein S1 [Deltaproteobacteria bacterium]